MLIASLVVACFAILVMAWKLLHGAPSAPAATPAAASVSRELARLDPFSFFVLSGAKYGAQHVVVGTTGAFSVRVTTSSVDGKLGREIGEARRTAKRVQRGLGDKVVHTTVRPVLCVAGRQFPPRVSRGVRIIPWGMIVNEVSERRRALSPHQAQRVAEALGGLPRRARTLEDQPSVSA